MRQPGCKTLENHLLEMLAGPPESRAQQFYELQRQVGLAPKKRNEIPTIDPPDLAIDIRDCIGRTSSAIEDRYLAKYFTGANEIEQCVFPLRRGGAHSNSTAYNPEQARAGITSQEDMAPPCEFLNDDMLAELRERGRLEIAKDRVPTQYRQSVGGTFTPLLRRHGNAPSCSPAG
jgi:hypothetical protein